MEVRTRGVGEGAISVEGKRAIADIGSHWMDLIEYITGLRIKLVCADFATFYPTRKKPLKPVETYAGKVLQPEDYQDIPINTEDYAAVLFRFENDARGVMTVNQVAAGRKNRLYFELDGSEKSVAWESETPNQIWIGKRDGNNEIMMRDIVNYTSGSDEIRVRIPIGIAYDADVDKAKEIIRQVSLELEWVMKDPPPKAVVKSFGESAVDLEARVWISQSRKRMDTISYVTDRVKTAFQREGIEIPFPKRDIYIKQST